MKGKFALMLFFITFSLLSTAQKTNFGIISSFNLTSNSGKGLSSSMVAGFEAGAFADVKLSEKLGLQPELSFSLRNTKRANNFTVFYNYNGRSDANIKIQLSYITLPVLLKYNLNKNFVLNAGPQFGYLIYDNENLLIGGKEAFKKTDAGVVLGAQYKITSGFNFFARYYYGLTNINNIDDRYKWYTRQVQTGFSVNIL